MTPILCSSHPRCYILGPMRGHIQYNFPAFDQVENRLTDLGYIAVSPAAIDRKEGFDPKTLPSDFDWKNLPEGMELDKVITRDIAALRECAYYVALPGWEKSVGARAEKALLDWQGAMRLDQENSYRPWTESATPPAWPKGGPLSAAERVADSLLVTPTGEVRIIDAKTGGQKGQKLQRFDLIPGEPLMALAEVYGRGALKYEDDNWMKGYSWRLSFGALNRHLWLWWLGETRDPETGCHHLAQVAWHAFTLLWFQKHSKGTDDRSIQGCQDDKK